MKELGREIEHLLKHHNRKPPKLKHQSQPKINSSYSEYVGGPTHEGKLKSHNYLQKHNEQLENRRLYNKLTQIQSRDALFNRSAEEDQMLNRVYQLNVASRRLQRCIKEKDLQKKNSQFIQRIVQIKAGHSPRLNQGHPAEHTRRKRNKSSLLPPIRTE